MTSTLKPPETDETMPDRMYLYRGPSGGLLLTDIPGHGTTRYIRSPSPSKVGTERNNMRTEDENDEIDAAKKAKVEGMPKRYDFYMGDGRAILSEAGHWMESSEVLAALTERDERHKAVSKDLFDLMEKYTALKAQSTPGVERLREAFNAGLVSEVEFEDGEEHYGAIEESRKADVAFAAFIRALARPAEENNHKGG